MMSIDKDPSSLMDEVAVGGTFGGGRTANFSIHQISEQKKSLEGSCHLKSKDC